MSFDIGDVAGVVAGFKAGKIAESEARHLLRQYGTGDDTIDGLLALGAGIAVGSLFGGMVDSAVDNLLGDLF